jgi:hypothetical protein
MIELDVHERAPGIPVISHASKYANRTWFGSMREDFNKSLQVISDHLIGSPSSSPIIIDFEFGSLSFETQVLMADQVEEILGKFLVYGRMDFRTTYPLDYLGKVILSCGGGATEGLKLRNLMNVLQRDDYWFRNRAYPSNNTEAENIRDWTLSTNGFSRVYPKNVMISSNIDGVEVMTSLNAQAVAMNYGLKDRLLHRYIDFFDGQELVGYRPRASIVR